MLSSIDYPSDNRSGRKWVVLDQYKRRACDHSVSSSAFEPIPSFLLGAAKKRAAIVLFCSNLFRLYKYTLVLVESSEVRVCSYSLQLFIKRHHAYGYFVISTRSYPRNTVIDTVLAENGPEPKQSVCFNSTGQRIYVRRNSSRYYDCVLMPRSERDGVNC